MLSSKKTLGTLETLEVPLQGTFGILTRSVKNAGSGVKNTSLVLSTKFCPRRNGHTAPQVTRNEHHQWPIYKAWTSQPRHPQTTATSKAFFLDKSRRLSFEIGSNLSAQIYLTPDTPEPAKGLNLELTPDPWVISQTYPSTS